MAMINDSATIGTRSEDPFAPKGRPDGELATSGGDTRQEQRRQVGARDSQKEDDRGQQQEQHLARAPDELIAQRDHGHVGHRRVVAVLLLQSPRHDGRLRPRRVDGDAVCHPGDDLPVMARPIGIAWELFSRRPDVGGDRKVEPRRHDTDNRVRLTAQAKSGG